MPPLGMRVAWRNNSLRGPSRCCLRSEEALGGGGTAETPAPQKGARGRALSFWRRWCVQTGAAPPFCCLSRESSERKKEASKFLNGDSCYVISRAAPSGRREAGAGERQRRPHAARPCSRKPVSGHLGESQPLRPLGWGGKRAPKISQGTLIALLCPLTNGGARQSQEGKAAGRFRGARGVRHVRGGVIGGRGFTPGSPHLPGLPRPQTASRSPLLPLAGPTREAGR